jgi:hypothetical protein
MLHNVNMIMGLGFIILPTYLKKKKEKMKKMMTLVWMVIFVKTSIKATIHSIAFMCECTKFLAWLFSWLLHTKCFFTKILTIILIVAFFYQWELNIVCEYVLTTYGTFTLQIKLTEMLTSDMSNNKLLTYY